MDARILERAAREGGPLQSLTAAELAVDKVAVTIDPQPKPAVFPGVLRLIATWFPAQRGPLMSQLTGLVGQAGQLLALAPLASLLHATSWEIAFGRSGSSAGCSS